MNAEVLKSKKITLATLKSFIKNAGGLFVEQKSSFDGMVDCVVDRNLPLKSVTKENAIGIDGVWVVGCSRDLFTFRENENYYGIEVYNSCGTGILWAKK